MLHQSPLFKATYIPGWYLGPTKKLPDLMAQGAVYRNPDAPQEDEMKEK